MRKSQSWRIMSNYAQHSKYNLPSMGTIPYGLDPCRALGWRWASVGDAGPTSTQRPAGVCIFVGILRQGTGRGPWVPSCISPAGDGLESVASCCGWHAESVVFVRRAEVEPEPGVAVLAPLSEDRHTAVPMQWAVHLALLTQNHTVFLAFHQHWFPQMKLLFHLRKSFFNNIDACFRGLF